jgi:hypothetical protein
MHAPLYCKFQPCSSICTHLPELCRRSNACPVRETPHDGLSPILTSGTESGKGRLDFSPYHNSVHGFSSSYGIRYCSCTTRGRAFASKRRPGCHVREPWVASILNGTKDYDSQGRKTFTKYLWQGLALHYQNLSRLIWAASGATAGSHPRRYHPRPGIGILVMAGIIVPPSTECNLLPRVYVS